MSDNQLILYIPGVFGNINEERIRRIFGDLNLGEVTRVDIIVPKKTLGAEEKNNSSMFKRPSVSNRVFVHINWNDNPNAVAARERLEQGKEIKIVYDDPWFWRVSAYRPPAPKPKGGRRRKTIRKRKSIRRKTNKKRKHN